MRASILVLAAAALCVSACAGDSTSSSTSGTTTAGASGSSGSSTAAASSSAGSSGASGSTSGGSGSSGSSGSQRDYDTLQFAPDGTGLGGASATPLVFDVARRYANDAAFRANIANYGQAPGDTLAVYADTSKAGTGSGQTALYTDGRYPDLIDWSASAGPGGEPAFVLTVKALDLPSSSPTPELAASAHQKSSLWLWVRRHYDVGFSAYGDADDANGAASWNQTQGAGLKIGPYAAYGYHDSKQSTTYYGRAGLQSGNGSQQSTAVYSLVNLPQGTPQPSGIDDTNIGNTGTAWTDDAWRDYLVYVANTVESDGVIHDDAQAWVRVRGSGGFVPIGPALSGTIGPSDQFDRPVFLEIAPFMLNANHARKTDEHLEVWGWAAYDADVYPDPFGVLGGG